MNYLSMSEYKGPLKNMVERFGRHIHYIGNKKIVEFMLDQEKFI